MIRVRLLGGIFIKIWMGRLRRVEVAGGSPRISQHNNEREKLM